MISLLAMLLYLQTIVAGGTYYQSEIDAYSNQNSAQIQEIENDPVLYQSVQDQYDPQAETIIVIDNSGY